jgi:hypothetical protein
VQMGALRGEQIGVLLTNRPAGDRDMTLELHLE